MNEDNQEIQAEILVTSGSEIGLQDLEILNNNIIYGSLYIVGCLGIISGILLGRAFNGIFRSK